MKTSPNYVVQLEMFSTIDLDVIFAEGDKILCQADLALIFSWIWQDNARRHGVWWILSDMLRIINTALSRVKGL